VSEVGEEKYNVVETIRELQKLRDKAATSDKYWIDEAIFTLYGMNRRIEALERELEDDPCQK
jgi:hypothetical protein